MGLSSTDKLAKVLGNTSLAVNDLQQNISPDEEDAFLQVRFTDTVELVGSLVVKKRVAEEGALVFDRPLEGQMFDNPNKSFDVGYDEEQDELIMTQEF